MALALLSNGFTVLFLLWTTSAIKHSFWPKDHGEKAIKSMFFSKVILAKRSLYSLYNKCLQDPKYEQYHVRKSFPL